ncbi:MULTISPECIES: NAD(P)H-dependent oxidoreductase [Acinetobacter]|jgi:FMN-dependent NADH-azoreductase|uniref:FMN dependent NADH:quinone oxidoreductase n=1 Tax=Acinetobacter pittii TaxID=48296 RepID=A0AAE9M615_ACIPI|nr:MULTISPECIES: NAD(P)H-dependent oxidoreductase [Acinetobacter calcoaceticus/baumannii complex]AZP29793.1 FMN-dependent NADH-azoreductase [Acinetobacter pittii]EXE27326.1 NADPH-dependent FMN reductase family protein [Acinetobacter sp. 907131]EXS16743.1 NADPH-dependent FMN reductase family protein [Acinetobacter sp. 883425]MBK0411220.1 NAD(P)H-dependent oxidoreductase [Acinetobacter pittii]MBK1417287.1 NAD(P)H-dependent oxidoreductase [Acinetobacter pittii]
MAKILVLKSSIMGEGSQTNRLIDVMLEHRKDQGLQDDITIRNLAEMNLPVLDLEIFQALRGAENVNQDIQQIVALSDELIAELKSANLLIIGAPMYNLNVPTQLKNWFDLVARARQTFRYTETYPQGLVEGVKAVVVSSRGGIHVGQETEAVTPYLKAVLGLMGIHDVDFIYAEGLDMQAYRSNALDLANQQVKKFAI